MSALLPITDVGRHIHVSHWLSVSEYTPAEHAEHSSPHHVTVLARSGGMLRMSEERTASYGHECKRPLTEVDNRGQILRACSVVVPQRRQSAVIRGGALSVLSAEE